MTPPDRRLNPWLTDVGFTIKETGHGYETTTEYESAGLGGGGGHSLAPAAANDMLGQARSALEDLQNLLRRTESLTRLKPPARDPASVATTPGW